MPSMAFLVTTITSATVACGGRLGQRIRAAERSTIELDRHSCAHPRQLKQKKRKIHRIRQAQTRHTRVLFRTTETRDKTIFTLPRSTRLAQALGLAQHESQAHHANRRVSANDPQQERVSVLVVAAHPSTLKHKLVRAKAGSPRSPCLSLPDRPRLANPVIHLSLVIR